MAAIAAGTILNSNNYGQFRVVSDSSANSVCIEFIKTGYRAIIRRDNARNGVVKDLFYPKIQGVGFIGEGKKAKGKAYSAWTRMFERCYSQKYQKKNPTYIGCTVEPEWHNFRNFEEWFNKTYKHGLCLDKDIKIPGNRVYGPSACILVTQKENNIKAKAKYYVFLSPDGTRHEVYNLAEFSRKHGLDDSSMARVHNGKRPHHRGWTKQLFKVYAQAW